MVFAHVYPACCYGRHHRRRRRSRVGTLKWDSPSDVCHTWRFSFCAAQASIQPWFMAGSVVVLVLEMHV